MPKEFPKFGPYSIIADTNALYARDPKKLVSGGFEAALVEIRKLTTIHLYVPDVVLGELAYQKYEFSVAAITAAEKQLSVLCEITGVKQPKICSATEAKRRILRKYQSWCKSVNAQRYAPKVRHALWSKIVDDAIWRMPPFERSEDRKHEKGFRDRVVLEAVTQLCKNAAMEIVLLCEDGMLSAAAGVCGAKNLTVVPRLEDFTSRVRLMKENAEKEWVAALFAEAARTFYSKDVPDCIYWRDKISEKVDGRVADLVPPTNLAAIFSEPAAWERQTQERITLGTTQYDKIGGGRWMWSTAVKSAAAFSGKDFSGVVSEKIRVSVFSAKWSSQVSQSAEIVESKFEELVLVDRQMIADTVEARTQWSLPAKPVTLPTSLMDIFKNLPSTASGQSVSR